MALCFGWIDGQSKRFDDDYTLQAYTPRRKNSPWSQINQGHVERLIAEGRMRPQGQAEIDRAKADGRWDAAYRVKDAAPPAELAAALQASPAASEAWAALTKQNRFAIIFRTSQLKRPESRERAAAKYVAMLERGEKPY
ncbi:MAG: YdeI/OmpD-associated family protein [Schumannella sp.]